MVNSVIHQQNFLKQTSKTGKESISVKTPSSVWSKTGAYNLRPATWNFVARGKDCAWRPFIYLFFLEINTLKATCKPNFSYFTWVGQFYYGDRFENLVLLWKSWSPKKRALHHDFEWTQILTGRLNIQVIWNWLACKKDCPFFDLKSLRVGLKNL